MEVATQNPDILPRVFNLAEMRKGKDVELFQKLLQVQISLKQLLELVDNTTTIAQIESYTAALAVYGYTKSCGKAVALQEAMADLGKRFSRKPATPAKSDSPTTPSNSPT